MGMKVTVMIHLLSPGRGGPGLPGRALWGLTCGEVGRPPNLLESAGLSAPRTQPCGRSFGWFWGYGGGRSAGEKGQDQDGKNFIRWAEEFGLYLRGDKDRMLLWNWSCGHTHLGVVPVG